MTSQNQKSKEGRSESSHDITKQEDLDHDGCINTRKEKCIGDKKAVIESQKIIISKSLLSLKTD